MIFVYKQHIDVSATQLALMQPLMFFYWFTWVPL